MIKTKTARHFLIKPASGYCNIACRYCFYRDVVEHRQDGNLGMMSTQTAQKLIERAFDLNVDELSFAFQGGEPTLAGLPFFENFVQIVGEQAALAKNKAVQVQFSLQTNGIAIDERWSRFFKRENFLLGLSIDGPRLLHDSFRVYADGSGTYSTVMNALAALKAQNVDVNALCVVDAATADNAQNVYRHLRSRGFDWIQFIPCLDPLGEEPGAYSWSLTPKAYAQFLRQTFDLRYAEWEQGVPVNVRWLDNLVGMAMGNPPESCGMAGRCPVNFTVEADGSVYPCDFYVTDEWKLGNVHTHDFQTMMACSVAERFVTISRQIDPACQNCFAWPLCRGGCRRDREPAQDDKLRLNRYCPSFKDFFAYAGERIMKMAEFERSVRSSNESQ